MLFSEYPLSPVSILHIESSVATFSAGGKLAMACYHFELVCCCLGILAPVTYVLTLRDQWQGVKRAADKGPRGELISAIPGLPV